MGTVSFPITLTGDYVDGSACNAAEYRADFEKLRDAVNQMHERFNSFCITATLKDYVQNPKSGSEFYEPARFNDITHVIADSGSSARILNVIEVPSWLQGIRVRDIQVVNLSKLPVKDGASGTGTVIGYHPMAAVAGEINSSAGLTFGVSYRNRAADFIATSATDMAATAIGTVNLDTETKLRGPTETSGTVPINVQRGSTTSNIAIPAGSFIGVWVAGGVNYRNTANNADTTPFGLNWHFQVNVLCDTMVPVP